MIEDVIKITSANTDLPRHPKSEYWQSATYGTMNAKVKAAVDQRYGWLPRPTSKYIREITFKIKGDTTLEAVQKLCQLIHERYRLYCFQIAFDRLVNEVHLLFLWMHFDDCKIIYLNDSDQKKLSVTILRHLNLPRPLAADGWLRMFLLETWQENPEAYDKALDWLDHAHATAPIYTILRDSLVYAQRVSKGLSK